MMMRKILVAFFILIVIFFSACTQPEREQVEGEEVTPEETPSIPEETPETTPEGTPGTPEETPEVTPEGSPEETPGESPEETPETTPEMTPEETPREIEEGECIGEGESIPVIAKPQECCNGLGQIQPKEPDIVGIAGYCTNKCGDGICDEKIESAFNCPNDCAEKGVCGNGVFEYDEVCDTKGNLGCDENMACINCSKCE